MVTEGDKLSERGGKANHHKGNKRYRKAVSEMKAQDRHIEAKTAKIDLAKSIVEYVDNYDGRYFVMTKAAARKRQARLSERPNS